MSDPPPGPCIACGKPMELGSLLDQGMGGIGHALWARGNPVAGRAETRDRELRLVVAYRCPSCGRLELYAEEVLQPGGVPDHWKNPPPFE